MKMFLRVVLLCASALLAAAQDGAASTPKKKSADTQADTQKDQPCPASPTNPKIAEMVREGATEIKGSGEALPSGCTARIEIHDVSGDVDRLLKLTAGATGNVSDDGTFSVVLAEPLREGQSIVAVEIFTGNDKPVTTPATGEAAPNPTIVVVPGDWGRVKGYFTSGILISQNQNSFSQSSLYLGFTLDKTWRLPGYYYQVLEKNKKQVKVQDKKKPVAGKTAPPSKTGTGPGPRVILAMDAVSDDVEENEQPSAAPAQANAGQAADPAPKRSGRWPGINTYFDVRLTQIPVSACATPTTSTAANQPSPCATPSPTPSPTPTNLETFISSQKSARLATGIYFPWTVSSWTYNKVPNALFLAPLAKVGFDTPAGSLTQVQPAATTGTAAVSNTGTVTAVNPTNFYNFYAFGGRIGHYAMGTPDDHGRAPDLISYIDVAFGPYSNLETLVVPDGAPAGTIPGRKRLYRIAIEGFLKVPTTPLILGFNANIGQEAVGTGGFNIVQRAGDDLRFLFGAKFDVAKLLSHVMKNAP